MADKNRLYLKNRYATPVRKDLQVRGAKQTEIEQRIDLKAEKGEKSEQKNIEKKFLKISKIHISCSTFEILEVQTDGCAREGSTCNFKRGTEPGIRIIFKSSYLLLTVYAIE